MTGELAFRARELSASGIWSGRIAELLEVDERVVLRVLRGEDVDDVPAPGTAEVVVEEPEPEPEAAPADPDAWPPLVDESTVWTTVRPVVPRTNVQGGEVQVRRVLLWGKSVWINAAGEVWCTDCVAFRTPAQLSHPFNSCPVGLPARGGPVWFDGEAPDPEPRYLPVSGGGGVVDFMRVPW
jgi:hypothetical protein